MAFGAQRTPANAMTPLRLDAPEFVEQNNDRLSLDTL